MMDLIPKALIAGIFVPPTMPGQSVVTMEKLNQIWSDVAPRTATPSSKRPPIRRRPTSWAPRPRSV